MSFEVVNHACGEARAVAIFADSESFYLKPDEKPQFALGAILSASSLTEGFLIRNEKTPCISAWGFFFITSLTITYFHTGCSTIIGVISFHGPVRDGKGWYRFTMVIRHNLYRHVLPTGQHYLESGRSIVLCILLWVMIVNCDKHNAYSYLCTC